MRHDQKPYAQGSAHQSRSADFMIRKTEATDSEHKGLTLRA